MSLAGACGTYGAEENCIQGVGRKRELLEDLGIDENIIQGVSKRALQI
jgi:hypothetical protein